MLYLDLLDDAIAEGLRYLGPAFCRAQLDHVLARQRPDGGFPGRLGDSDLYYTEFALRTLVLLDAPTEALAAAVPFLAAHASSDELTEVFSLLNARRLLAARGVHLSVDEGTCRDEIVGRHVRSGGYGRPTAGGATAYATFLAALSLELLGDKLPAPALAVGAITALQNPDGGFGQEADGASQTNSTAAAIAFLTLADALDADVGGRARDYLLAQQDSGGGFVSRSGAPGDLLSTFTALTTLLFLEGVAQVGLAGVARFTRACAGPAGGFGAHPGDTETDVEYTYYGVATLALLAGLTP